MYTNVLSYLDTGLILNRFEWRHGRRLDKGRSEGVDMALWRRPPVRGLFAPTSRRNHALNDKNAFCLVLSLFPMNPLFWPNGFHFAKKTRRKLFFANKWWSLKGPLRHARRGCASRDRVGIALPKKLAENYFFTISGGPKRDSWGTHVRGCTCQDRVSAFLPKKLAKNYFLEWVVVLEGTFGVRTYGSAPRWIEFGVHFERKM